MMFGILAWLGFLLLSGIVIPFQGSAEPHWFDDLFLGLLVAFTPVIIPMIGYKLAAGWLERARRKSMELEDTDAVRSHSIN